MQAAESAAAPAAPREPQQFIQRKQYAVDLFVEDAGTGRVDAVKAAIAAGVDVNGKSTRRGDSALHYAVASRDEAMVKLLLESHASPTLKGSYGETPTWLAARWGTLPILKLLVDAGGSLQDVDAEGVTAVLALVTCPSSRMDDAAARLKAMLEMDVGLDITKLYQRKTAEVYAMEAGRDELVAILQAAVRVPPPPERACVWEKGEEGQGLVPAAGLEWAAWRLVCSDPITVVQCDVSVCVCGACVAVVHAGCPPRRAPAGVSVSFVCLCHSV